MINRLVILSMIGRIMTRIKTTDCRDQRFTLLDNADILARILHEVTIYEKNLLMDLDVD
jgi:hypothetical protein